MCGIIIKSGVVQSWLLNAFCKSANTKYAHKARYLEIPKDQTPMHSPQLRYCLSTMTKDHMEAAWQKVWKNISTQKNWAESLIFYMACYDHGENFIEV